MAKARRYIIIINIIKALTEALTLFIPLVVYLVLLFCIMAPAVIVCRFAIKIWDFYLEKKRG